MSRTLAAGLLWTSVLLLFTKQTFGVQRPRLTELSSDRFVLHDKLLYSNLVSVHTCENQTSATNELVISDIDDMS